MTISANAKDIRNEKYKKGKTYIVLQSPQKTKWKNIIRHMSRYIKLFAVVYCPTGIIPDGQF